MNVLRLDRRRSSVEFARTELIPLERSPVRPTARAAWVLVSVYGVVALAVVAGFAGSVVTSGMIACSTVVIVIGVRLNRPQLAWPFWGIVAAGAFWLIAGAAREATGSTGDLTAHRSLVPDVIALPGYAAYGIGLLAMIRARDGRNRSAVLDAAVVSVAGFLLAWRFLIARTLESEDVSLVAQGSIILYPVIDCAFVALACRLAFTSGRRLAVHGLILVAMIGLLVSDVAYVLDELQMLRLGARRDLGYMTAAAAMAAAGLHPSVKLIHLQDTMARRPLPMARAALLALSMFLPAGLFIFGIDTGAVRALPFQLGAITLAAIATFRLLDSVRNQNVTSERLTWQAGHDSLTGLPNRPSLTAIIHGARARRDASALVIAYFDLDHFKNVNDVFGHAFGDRLLIDVAARLRERLPDTVVLGRIGGDEFVAIADAEEFSPEALAAYVQSALAHPFVLDGLTATTSASIGLTVWHGERSADAVLRDADTAMYRAKEAGRDTYRVFADDMRVQVERRMTIEASLRSALANGGELCTFFQPIVDLDTGETVGFEALARWFRDDGPVSPVEFIAVAEEAGLIGQLGAVVLDQACQGVARARARTGRDLFVAVNVSARQLADDAIVDVVADALARHGLPGDALCLEITESIMVNDHNVERLYALRRLGAWLAVDDFGTGYSSLSYLRRMPVAKVKIDKSFVDDIAHGDPSIMVAIISMAHSLGLGCVAEGVEREEQARRIRELGCDGAQGYLWAAPAPIDEALAALVATTPVA